MPSFGFADVLAFGAATARDLAAKAGTDPEATFRLLRALASVGVLAADGPRFVLTPVGETLRSDVPHSMRDMRARRQGRDTGCRGAAFATRSAPARARPAPRSAARSSATMSASGQREAFVGAMRGLASLVAREAPRVYDASAHRVICDVGGSSGTVAAGFLQANPSSPSSVLDMAEVVPLATTAIDQAGLAQRCRAIGGDFSVDVPAADLYVLKQVLHDWNDEQCRTILRNCAKHLPSGGRVLVIEMVIPDDGAPSAAQLMDLNMLVMLPGRERTAGQYRELFASAELRLLDIRPTHSPFQVVVAEKA